MQFFILLLGILIFSFYLHQKAPIFFDDTRVAIAMQSAERDSLLLVEAKYNQSRNLQQFAEAEKYRATYKRLMQKQDPGADVNDNNYIFLRFVKDQLPVGMVGLIFAVIFLAAWGSIAAALNSLAACSMVDFHQRYFQKGKAVSEETNYSLSKWYTFGWGIFCIVVAMFTQNIGNSLIEAVNIIGSLFYGVILGIFLVAFWIKFIGGKAVFYAAVITEILVYAIFRADVISFLWLNVIGALLLIVLAAGIQYFIPKQKNV
jgi:Na+/proline symporter